MSTRYRCAGVEQRIPAPRHLGCGGTVRAPVEEPAAGPARGCGWSLGDGRFVPFPGGPWDDGLKRCGPKGRKPMSLYRFEVATPDADAELRQILAETPMPGRVV